jgi:solute carrier family 45 protein 1/2/4
LHLRSLHGHGALCDESQERDNHYCCLRRVRDAFHAFPGAVELTCYSSWSIACWAPFAFLGVEINRINNSSYSSHPKRSSIDLDAAPKAPQLHQGLEEAASSGGASSGQYLGIMNLYTTLPQFVGTGISWAVFSILEPGKSPELSEAPLEERHTADGPNAIAVCLFIGACSACCAVVATRRLKRIQGR